MKSKVTLAATGLCGMFAGVLMVSGGIKLQTVSLAGLLAVPVTITGLIVADSKAQARVNAAEEKACQAQRTLDAERLITSAGEEREAKLRLEFADVQQNFARAKDLLKACEQERGQSASSITQLNNLIAQLQTSLGVSRERIDELEAEVEEWEREFTTRTNTEAEKRYLAAKQAEIKRIEAENDEITREAMEIAKAYREWAVEVDERLQDRGEYIKSVTNQYNNHLDGLKGSVSTQVQAYLEQIEILHNKIAMLQQKLEGDLVAPEFGQFGFDQNGRITNAIAEYLWTHHQIPLKVTGFDVAEGVITAGYCYSRSTTPEALSQVVERDSSSIARTLGLYAVEKPQKLQIADVFTVRIRRERPAKKTASGSLYRSKEEFIKYILSQPVRLRIVGEPGAGKTPTVAVLLSHLLTRGFLEANTPNGRKLPYCVVESCNPLAGISVKNGEELDFCLRWNDGKKGFKGLTEEYKFRKNPTNAEYKNSVGYIWVADEIDNTMAELTKDEAKPFKDALKDGGHVNLGVIVMGQSANVSTSKGLSIDDQKMMTNIYIDPVSIRTFLTQYGERFYSKKAVEKALNTLEELELEIEEQNEIICDTAREFRIAMVTANRSPVFYQLPYFDSVAIDVNEYQEILSKVTVIKDGRGGTGVSKCVQAVSGNLDTVSISACPDVHGHSPYVGSGTDMDTSIKPTCIYCGSDLIRSKKDRWLCENPNHSTTAPNKPKSWKK